MDFIRIAEEIRAPAHNQPIGLVVLGLPDGKTAFDQLTSERINLLTALGDFLTDVEPQLGQGSAFDQRVEEVCGLTHRGRGLAGGRHDHPVFDVPVGKDENHEGAVGGEADELDVLDDRILFWRQDKAGAIGDG